MSIKLVLFDLDGTLLPMEQEMFVKAYFGGLAKKLAPYGYEQKKLIDAIWSGTKAMIMNNGEITNEEVFWKRFCEIFGEEALKDQPIFADFYENEFHQIKSVCGFNPEAKQTVEKIKAMGYRVALATNPIFPDVATRTRISWTGLKAEDFEIYTTYENSNYCKPTHEYYRDILNKLGIEASECLMVGNDVAEDMVAESLGMKVFLLTDCIINKENKDSSVYPQGDFSKLIQFIEKSEVKV